MGIPKGGNRVVFRGQHDDPAAIRRLRWADEKSPPPVETASKGCVQDDWDRFYVCCWDVDKSELSDRSDRPWDNTARRPSHADRRRYKSREMLQQQFLAALPRGPDYRKLWTPFQDVIAFAA